MPFALGLIFTVFILRSYYNVGVFSNFFFASFFPGLAFIIKSPLGTSSPDDM